VTEQTIMVPAAEFDSERLDSFLARSLTGLTRSAIQRLIEQGLVTVDGAGSKPSLKLKGGERLVVAVPDPEPATAVAEDIPLVVLYEDHDLIVIDKPAGLVVHPGAGNPRGTLVNALLGHCHDLSGVGGELRPGIVHRLDKDTSGVLVAAKNDTAHQGLASQFAAHSVKRHYLALVFGSPRTDSGRLEGTIGRHPVDRTRMSGRAKHGKHAVTHWRVLARYPEVTLVRLKLETGRTHQIRVHLSEAGFPLVGDQLYSTEGRLGTLHDTRLRAMIREMGRQALHAATLGFRHPATGEYLEFTTEPPADLARILAYLADKRLPGAAEEPPAGQQGE
jgi:23S rRNA pseudouridine1911/1915/1917 synthase